MIRKIADTKKPVILSTGASNIKEIKRAVNILKLDKSLALELFAEGKGGFIYKDLYTFCEDDAGMLTGHPISIGLEFLTFIDSDGKNIGKEFLKVAEVGKVKKVTFKITYPKDTIMNEDKELSLIHI